MGITKKIANASEKTIVRSGMASGAVTPCWSLLRPAGRPFCGGEKPSVPSRKADRGHAAGAADEQRDARVGSQRGSLTSFNRLRQAGTASIAKRGANLKLLLTAKTNASLQGHRVVAGLQFHDVRSAAQVRDADHRVPGNELPGPAVELGPRRKSRGPQRRSGCWKHSHNTLNPI